MLAPLPSVQSAENTGLVERAAAIGAFGVSYLYANPREPVVEVLGWHKADPDPGRNRTVYSSEPPALAHARKALVDEIEREIARLDPIVATRSARIRLWFARNWPRMRDAETGILATEALLDKLYRRRADLLEGRERVEIRRLPPVLRMPRILSVGAAVHVIDLSRFPDEKASLKVDSIRQRRVLAVHEHSAFDAVVRYELTATPGVFALDTPDIAAVQLSGQDPYVRVFLHESDARRETQRLSENMRSIFGIVTPPLAEWPTVIKAPGVETSQEEGQAWGEPPDEAPAPLFPHLMEFMSKSPTLRAPGGLSPETALAPRLMHWLDATED